MYPQPGRGSGWSLLGGARTDLSGLTAPDAQALFVLLGPSADIVPEARSALRRLVRALPGPFRRDAEAAARARVVDRGAWGGRPRTGRRWLSRCRPPWCAARRYTWSTPAGRPATAGRLARRPLGPGRQEGRWYLVAGTDRGPRTFRLDRIVEAEATELPANRPAEFELADAWRQVVEEVGRRRSRTARGCG